MLQNKLHVFVARFTVPLDTYMSSPRQNYQILELQPPCSFEPRIV